MRRAHWSTALLYLIMSVPIGGWAARVPEIRRQTGADEALWGVANNADIGGRSWAASMLAWPRPLVLWCPLYVADTMAGGPVAGGIAYTCAVTAVTAALLLVNQATTRVGMIRLARISALVGAGGLGVCLLINGPVAATAGFVILSIGVAAVNPSIYTLAGSRPDLTTSESVSVVEVAQMPGASIAAPAVIAALSSFAGLRVALGTVVVATAAIGRSPGRSAGRR